MIFVRQTAIDLGPKTALAVTSDLYVDAKLDGWRLALGCGPDGMPFARIRTGDVWHKLNSLSWARDIVTHLPPGSVIDGELYVPEKPSTEVPRSLAHSADLLRFAAFGVPLWEGADVSAVDMFVQEARCRQVGCAVVVRQQVLAALSTLAAELPGVTHLARQEASQVLRGIRQQVDAGQYSGQAGYAQTRSQDIEGLVFKAPGSGLGGPTWHKYKPVLTVDCVCMGTEDGKGKFVGLVGALRAGLWCAGDGNKFLFEVASVGGMTDAERENMGDSDVGRVFEVEYQCLGAKNRLRHPRFKRWRDDKPAEECTWNQL